MQLLLSVSITVPAERGKEKCHPIPPQFTPLIMWLFLQGSPTAKCSGAKKSTEMEKNAGKLNVICIFMQFTNY